MQTAGKTYTRAVKYPREKLCIATHKRPIPSSSKQITCNNTQCDTLKEFKHLKTRGEISIDKYMNNDV